MVNIEDRDLYQLLISEFRYSVKRDNHLAPGTCANLIMQYLPEMSREWRAHTAHQLTDEIIADMINVDEKVLIAKGGRGGRGNAKFATSTRQVPKFAEQGDDGEQLNLSLELKLIVDVKNLV